MELRLYNDLRGKLLGNLAKVSERHDPAYQKAVEAYAPRDETGITKWGRDAIQAWLQSYNRLVSRPVRLRYYQILALYFTEEVLRSQRQATRRSDDNQRRNMLAYWMATGSGKTLLMHLNILQYIDHIGGSQAFDELEVIVTTPGVNLIEQHRREITPIIEKLNGEYARRIKLRVESTGSLLNQERGYFAMSPSKRHFRLVLVDEGHIGLAGTGKDAGAFKRLRHELADYDNAFLFEYSATYHGIGEKHVGEYAEQIVFDYNYYRFYRDGYGKDYAIEEIGLDRVAQGAEAWDNFQAAFETVADKLRVHDELRLRDNSALGFVSSFPDKPLIAFMGNTVEDRKDEGKDGKDEVSDIRKLLAYLAKLSFDGREALAPVFNGTGSGPLRLTRCPAVPDEIYLSWGEGAYWGIVNVGNGDKFFNDCENHPELNSRDGEPLIQLHQAEIVEPRFQFSEIDRPASPINVLIGSRKFAEGWNCFRVSAIGLINLGTSKGNKIIQIFGRGVRLRGLNSDGKRRYIDHAESYQSLRSDDTPQNRLRRLETLNIFSLKPSYLKTFLDALEKELPRHEVERRVPVATRSLSFGKTTETFEEYSARLPIFKVGRDDSEPRLVAVLHPDGKWEWSYVTPHETIAGTLAQYRIEMDYRPSPEQAPMNLARPLGDALAGTTRAAFAAVGDHAHRLRTLLDGRKLQLLKQDGVRRRALSPADVLGLISQVIYHRSWETLDFATQEHLIWQAIGEAIAKLHHRLIYDINKRRYRMAEPLMQAHSGQPGDFISHYNLRLAFNDEAEKAAFEAKFPSPSLPPQLELPLDGSRHIYTPLYRGGMDRGVRDLKLKTIAISPDALNPGERKFVEDLRGFLAEPTWGPRLSAHKFYLMRNVESLRSVGVYLDTETRAYFPDFVLWAISDKQTHILLVDPKGQSGIIDWNSLTTGSNAKVALAKSHDLAQLGRELGNKIGRECLVSSFIILRKSSPLGKANGVHYDGNIITEMENNHVLHLDWAPSINEQRLDEDGDPVPLPPDNRCYIERMFTLAKILNARQ